MTDSILLGKFKTLHKDRTKIKAGVKMLYILNVALTSWVIYLGYQIYTIHKLANVFYNAFPMAR